MIDLTWKIFSQTGNIEAYLLLKELEDEPQASEHHSPANSEAATQDTNL
ncbi:YqzL family protein [Ornithinibacillus gellani]|nr:YqzL family protein [Ornithinibacillus gellani]TQS74707.1 YqzL family protein [Ornithinibacillus gellani]